MLILVLLYLIKNVNGLLLIRTADAGKDLKGSVQTGHTRGEAIVQAVTHKDRVVQSQDYYSGRKESEVITVRKILKGNNLEGQKISIDALHCKPYTLEPINESGGTYLVGLKDNQKELLSACIDVIRFSKPTFNFIQAQGLSDASIKAKHGRIEKREYNVYNISKEEKHERWKNCKISTLIEVKRDITEVKTQKKHIETSYYISNEGDKYLELCHAIRGHWSVEVNNHIRDVTFAEDNLRSKKRIYHLRWLV